MFLFGFFLGVFTGIIFGVLYMVHVYGRQHRHSWTPWTRVINSDMEFTEVQERSCITCGFHEKNDPTPPEECPPHDWGQWEDCEITRQGGAKHIGQRRYCLDCSTREIKHG